MPKIVIKLPYGNGGGKKKAKAKKKAKKKGGMRHGGY